MKPVRVCLEVGAKKVFASALDWPGWCRSGKTEEAALEALADYAGRYAPVPQRAGIAFPPRQGPDFDVVERVEGDATTDFGAPGAVAKADAEPMAKKEAERQAALVQAAWEVLDDVAAHAPASLRKGPRGGGRDRDKMLDHVDNAQDAYARKMGLAQEDRTRDGIVEALRAARKGDPMKDKGWPPRYAARRIAWHVLDHAWEMEDKSGNG
ncbi:MAG TPA: hypothetical protein VGO92_06510 [Acidimicrobiales bacterium]|nr:hypothetical protein [Acidimicrobiales bacterium]